MFQKDQVRLRACAITPPDRGSFRRRALRRCAIIAARISDLTAPAGIARPRDPQESKRRFDAASLDKELELLEEEAAKAKTASDVRNIALSQQRPRLAPHARPGRRVWTV